jgi:hypothetical protein
LIQQLLIIKRFITIRLNPSKFPNFKIHSIISQIMPNSSRYKNSGVRKDLATSTSRVPSVRESDAPPVVSNGGGPGPTDKDLFVEYAMDMLAHNLVSAGTYKNKIQCLFDSPIYL